MQIPRGVSISRNLNFIWISRRVCVCVCSMAKQKQPLYLKYICLSLWSSFIFIYVYVYISSNMYIDFILKWLSECVTNKSKQASSRSSNNKNGVYVYVCIREYPSHLLRYVEIYVKYKRYVQDTRTYIYNLKSGIEIEKPQRWLDDRRIF